MAFTTLPGAVLIAADQKAESRQAALAHTRRTSIEAEPEFIGTPLKEVLTKLLPSEGRNVRRVDQSPLIAHLTSDENEWNDERAATKSRNGLNSSSPKLFFPLLRFPKFRAKAADESVPQLRERVLVDFRDAPIVEALQNLSEQVGLKVKIEKDSAAEEGLRTGTPVSLQLGVPISLQAALNLILEPRKLRYEIDGGYIIVRGQPTP